MRVSYFGIWQVLEAVAQRGLAAGRDKERYEVLLPGWDAAGSQNQERDLLKPSEEECKPVEMIKMSATQ